MSENKKVREFEVGDIYNEEIASLNIEARKNTLEGLSYVVINDGYTKILKPDEVTERRKELSDVSIIINDIEEEKKEVIKEFKERLAEPISKKKELLNSIKHKSEYRKGNLFHIDDQENGFMYIFDENAECIESRPLRPNERQGKIKQIFKDGTNG